MSARAVCALVENLVRLCPLPIQALPPGHPVRARVDCLATMMPHQPAGIDLLSLTALRAEKVDAKNMMNINEEHYENIMANMMTNIMAKTMTNIIAKIIANIMKKRQTN